MLRFVELGTSSKHKLLKTISLRAKTNWREQSSCVLVKKKETTQKMFLQRLKAHAQVNNLALKAVGILSTLKILWALRLVAKLFSNLDTNTPSILGNPWRHHRSKVHHFLPHLCFKFSMGPKHHQITNPWNYLVRGSPVNWTGKILGAFQAFISFSWTPSLRNHWLRNPTEHPFPLEGCPKSRGNGSVELVSLICDVTVEAPWLPSMCCKDKRNKVFTSTLRWSAISARNLAAPPGL